MQTAAAVARVVHMRFVQTGRLALGWPDARNHAEGGGHYKRMARPGLEPGTPRFSGGHAKRSTSRERPAAGAVREQTTSPAISADCVRWSAMWATRRSSWPIQLHPDRLTSVAARAGAAPARGTPDPACC